jgi:hypothetical protein
MTSDNSGPSANDETTKTTMEDEERPTRERIDRFNNRYEVYELEVACTIDPIKKRPCDMGY